MKHILLIPILFLTASCGYHLGSGENATVSIPYVLGDYDGRLTDALVYAVETTPNLQYCHSGGEWILKVEMDNDRSERIGFRYDRELETVKKTDPITKTEESVTIEKVGSNIVGIESRKEITVKVTLIDAASGDHILGPQNVKASVDYDYTDPNSRRDVFFPNPFNGGVDETTIGFSLGQLDAATPAGEDANDPIIRTLARKIVEGVLALGGGELECPDE